MGKEVDSINETKIIAIVVVATLVILGISAWFGWKFIISIDDSGMLDDLPDPIEGKWSSEKTASIHGSGLLYDDREPQTHEFNIARTMTIVELTAVLKWRDEPSDIGYVNEPDHFRMSIKHGEKNQIRVGENLYDGEGTVLIIIHNGNRTIEKIEGIHIEVNLFFAEDQLPKGGQNWAEKEDNSNEYVLDVEYTYREPL